jgi:hypothetical protein
MIFAKKRTVYFSPRRGRHFLTAKGAARAEANARMYKLFPSEREERDEDSYRVIWPGWSFLEVPRLVAVRDKLITRYLKKIKDANGGDHDK